MWCFDVRDGLLQLSARVHFVEVNGTVWQSGQKGKGPRAISASQDVLCKELETRDKSMSQRVALS